MEAHDVPEPEVSLPDLLCIIGVKEIDGLEEWDFEVPAYLPLAEIKPAIIRALDWDVTKVWQIKLLGTGAHAGDQSRQYVDERLSLADLDAWDGTVLEFHSWDPDVQPRPVRSLVGPNPSPFGIL